MVDDTSPPQSILIRGGRVIDPASDRDGLSDVLLEQGRIAAVAERLAPPPGARVIEARGLVVAPGFVDLHVHLREPGHEYKEDIVSGTRAEAAEAFFDTVALCDKGRFVAKECEGEHLHLSESFRLLLEDLL